MTIPMDAPFQLKPTSYLSLPESFYTKTKPIPVKQPKIFLYNDRLAKELGISLDPEAPATAALLSGNQLFEGTQPICQAYAGHQFGGFSPQLGDGRAHLLGEFETPAKGRFDFQLKGSGRTPFSRGGDGRAALGPMLREFLMSESMNALGIPTTQSLAVVLTGETVLRQRPLPGAILTRIAQSHLRVGTFEYFAARSQWDEVKLLTQYANERHQLSQRISGSPNVEDLLFEIAGRQARLIARWLEAGFIHGVMNTDNMSISGETIDYGPCGMLDEFNPSQVYSSIDHQGRYRYENQPQIAKWNLSVLAQCLLPTAGAPLDGKKLIESLWDHFDQELTEHYQTRMLGRLGIEQAKASDAELLNELLQTLEEEELDYHLSLRRLGSLLLDPTLRHPSAALNVWSSKWLGRIKAESGDPQKTANVLLKRNPLYVPRNHLIEAALTEASGTFKLDAVLKLLAVLRNPYDEIAGAEALAKPPAEDERVTQTFCGT